MYENQQKKNCHRNVEPQVPVAFSFFMKTQKICSKNFFLKTCLQQIWCRKCHLTQLPISKPTSPVFRTVYEAVSFAVFITFTYYFFSEIIGNSLQSEKWDVFFIYLKTYERLSSKKSGKARTDAWIEIKYLNYYSWKIYQLREQKNGNQVNLYENNSGNWFFF